MIWVIFFCPWGFVCYSQGVGCCCTNDGGSGLGLTHTVGPLVSFEGLPESTGSEYLKLWSVFGRFLKKACIGKSSVLLWSFFQLIEVRNWGLFFFTLNPSSNISSDTTRSATKRYRSVSWGYGGKINYVFIHWESMGSGLTDGFRWSMSRGSNKSPTTSLLLTFLLWHSAPIAGVALFRSNSLPISTSPSPITPRPKDPESLADPVWCRFGHLSRKAWRTRVFFSSLEVFLLRVYHFQHAWFRISTLWQTVGKRTVNSFVNQAMTRLTSTPTTSVGQPAASKSGTEVDTLFCRCSRRPSPTRGLL